MKNFMMVAAIFIIGAQANALSFQENMANSEFTQTSESSNEIVNQNIFQVINTLQSSIMSKVGIMGLSWKTGETASYKLDMGFIKGNMVMKVRQETANAFWLDQDIDLGFMGKQKIEALVDKNTGQVLELIVNGQKQDPPQASQSEVEETRQDKITVPAGTFDCIYARIKDTSKNEVSEAWINPSIVPIAGLIKQVSPSPMGKVTMELTSFEKK